MAPLLGILPHETKHVRAFETLTSSAIATFGHSKPLRVSSQAGNKNKPQVRLLVSFMQKRVYSSFARSSAQKLKPRFAPER